MKNPFRSNVAPSSDLHIGEPVCLVQRVRRREGVVEQLALAPYGCDRVVVRLDASMTGSKAEIKVRKTLLYYTQKRGALDTYPLAMIALGWSL